MSTNRKEERMSVAEIVEDLRDKISRGKYLPGDKLREIDMCSQYHVSRTPIREVFRLLQNEGVLQYLPHRGVQVADLTVEDVCTIQQTRGVLESLSCQMAAANIDEAGIARLRELNEEIKQVDVFDELGKYDDAFHETIASYSGNKVLIELLQQLERRAGILKYMLPFKRERTENTIKEHEDIIHALELRDGEIAKRYAEIHFKMSLNSLEEKMQSYLSAHQPKKKRRRRKKGAEV